MKTDISLDHTLIAVHDLKGAAKTFSEMLGFTLAPEGSHPGRGTHNHNIVFENEYVELIAIHNPVEREGSPLKDFLEKREGIYALALGVPDIRDVVTHLLSRELEAEQPRQGSLSRGPGEMTYTWKSAYVSPKATPGTRTLLVQHDYLLSERYKDFSSLKMHPNGVKGVHHVSIAVKDGEASARKWRHHFHLDASPGEEIIEGGLRRVRLQLRNCYLEFVSPTVEGEVSRFISEHGEGPMTFAFDVSDLNKARNHLQRNGVHLMETDGRLGEKAIYMNPRYAHGAGLQFVQSIAK